LVTVFSFAWHEIFFYCPVTALKILMTDNKNPRDGFTCKLYWDLTSLSSFVSGSPSRTLLPERGEDIGTGGRKGKGEGRGRRDQGCRRKREGRREVGGKREGRAGWKQESGTEGGRGKREVRGKQEGSERTEREARGK
jgi:hypothetical protein